MPSCRGILSKVTLKRLQSTLRFRPGMGWKRRTENPKLQVRFTKINSKLPKGDYSVI